MALAFRPGSLAVRVQGLDELRRDFSKLDKRLQKELGAQLKEIAEPAAETAQRLASEEGWGERTVSGIQAGRRGSVAVIRQRRKRTTRQHPEFGPLQLRKALIPAVEQHEEQIIGGVEDLLDRLTSNAGLGGGGIL